MFIFFSQEFRAHFTLQNEVILEELSLPALAELKGRWRGCLDASGGGNGDTMVDTSEIAHPSCTNINYKLNVHH